MSIRTMSHVWEHSQQKGASLLLLLAIADYANDDGRAWPSIATLANKIRMSERNTQRLLQRLSRCGEIEIEVNSGQNGVNVYRVTTPRRGDNLSGGGVTTCQGGGDSLVRGGGDSLVTRTVNWTVI